MAGGLGRALRQFWDRPGSVKRVAKGWHAQIAALTATPRGAAAAIQVGLRVKQQRTLVAWLTEEVEPNAANKRLINAAYRLMIGQWDDSVERHEYRIVGEIDSGDRSETRELIIEGREGQWDRIREAYLSGDDDDELEQLFIEDVIEEDVGETSGDGWGFPGGSYTV